MFQRKNFRSEKSSLNPQNFNYLFPANASHQTMQDSLPNNTNGGYNNPGRSRTHVFSYHTILMEEEDVI